MPAFRGSLRSLTCMVVIAVAAGGCGSVPLDPTAPVGPGVAASADLSPWMHQSSEVTCAAYLQHIWVHSQRGSYLTWAVHPVPDYEAAEVDIRQCPHAAGQLKEQEVVIRGRLLHRGDDHLPLLVALDIRPHPQAPALPIASR